MKRMLLAGSVVLLLLLSVSAVSIAQASPSGGEIQLIGKEWNRDPLKVYIQASPPFQPYIIHVQTALEDWSSALKEKSGSNNFNFEYVYSQKDADIVISIHPGAYAGVLGITNWVDKNNDGYFDKVKITVKIEGDVALEDFRNVIRHEIGHALGLGHETTEASDLMDPIYDAYETNVDVYPSDLDIEALLYIYKDDGFGGDNLPPNEIPSSYSA